MRSRINRPACGLALAISLSLWPQSAQAHQVQTSLSPAPCSSISSNWYFVGYAALSHTSSSQIAWNAIVYTKTGCALSESNIVVWPAGYMRVTGTLQHWTPDYGWSNCVNGTWGYNTAAVRYQAWMPTKYSISLKPCGSGSYRDRLIAQYKSGSTWITTLTAYTPTHTFT